MYKLILTKAKKILKSIFNTKSIEDSNNENYFFIDESGVIGGSKEKVFIHGCIITRTPDKIQAVLDKLVDTILHKPYYEEYREKFKKQGLHAVENHFDVRKEVYEELVYLDWRAYIIILKKDSVKFRDLFAKGESSVFKYTLYKLLVDRLKKKSNEKNKLIFETIDVSGQSLKSIIKEFYSTQSSINDFEWVISGKDEVNLSVVDFINYILYSVLTAKEKYPNIKMEENFRLLQSKIAMIHFPHNNVYLSRKDSSLTVDKIKENWRG